MNLENVSVSRDVTTTYGTNGQVSIRQFVTRN